VVTLVVVGVMTAIILEHVCVLGIGLHQPGDGTRASTGAGP
jgi:hypothetical protein